MHILEVDKYNKVIKWQSRYSLVTTKVINSFKIWHQYLLYAGDKTVIQIIKVLGIDVKKPNNWTYRMCMLAKLYKQIFWEILVQSKEVCAELYINIILIKLQGLGGFNYCLIIIDGATIYT
jgi:hypothetical protein